jgi:hypothetical protein
MALKNKQTNHLAAKHTIPHIYKVSMLKTAFQGAMGTHFWPQM